MRPNINQAIAVIMLSALLASISISGCGQQPTSDSVTTSVSEISSPPIADKDYVFFGCEDGTFYALDQNTGGIAWKFLAPGKIVGDATQDAENVYFSSYRENDNGLLYSINKTSGNINWVSDMSAQAYSGPVIEGDFIYAISGVEKKTAVDAFSLSSGSFLCNAYCDYGQQEPFAYGGTFFCEWGSANDQGPENPQAIKAFKATNGDELWEYSSTGIDTYFVGASAETVFCLQVTDYKNHAAVIALDAITGQEKWKQDEPFQIYAIGILGNSLILDKREWLEGEDLHYPVPTGFLALDIKTGEEKWNIDASDWLEFVLKPVDTGTSGLRFFFVSSRQEEDAYLCQVDAESGETITSEIKGWTNPDYPIPATTIKKDVIYLTKFRILTSEEWGSEEVITYICALRTDGQVLWERELPLSTYCPGAVKEGPVIAGTNVADSCGAGSYSVCAVDGETGDIKWEFDGPKN